MPTLYVPRRETRLTYVDGEAVSLNGPLPSVLARPVVYSPLGEISGLASGYRSALISHDEKMYKIKGIKPKKRPRSKRCGESHGGLNVANMMMEIENTTQIAEMCASEG